MGGSWVAELNHNIYIYIYRNNRVQLGSRAISAHFLGSRAQFLERKAF